MAKDRGRCVKLWRDGFLVCVLCVKCRGGVVHGSGVKGGRYRDTLVVMCSD